MSLWDSCPGLGTASYSLPSPPLSYCGILLQSILIPVFLYFLILKKIEFKEITRGKEGFDFFILLTEDKN